MLRLVDRRDIATTLRGTETFVGRAQERLTVNELLDAYYANRELALVGNMKNLRSAIKTLREAFGTWRAPDVTRPRLEQWAVHDLRRTFVRDAENANVPRSSGKAVTGHGIRTVSDVASAMLSVQDYRDQLSRKRESVILVTEARSVGGAI